MNTQCAVDKTYEISELGHYKQHNLTWQIRFEEYKRKINKEEKVTTATQKTYIQFSTVPKGGSNPKESPTGAFHAKSS